MVKFTAVTMLKTWRPGNNLYFLQLFTFLVLVHCLFHPQVAFILKFLVVFIKSLNLEFMGILRFAFLFVCFVFIRNAKVLREYFLFSFYLSGSTLGLIFQSHISSKLLEIVPFPSDCRI